MDEILRGESQTVEFKESLPKDSEKYVKAVIAFANTQGGEIVFGVTDERRDVVGIDEAILFQTMDSISNAIFDSAEPQIAPTIEPCTIDGKIVIVVTVFPEPHRPYCLKSKGRDNGTYVRVGATTRLAGLEKIKELDREGARISWDDSIPGNTALANVGGLQILFDGVGQRVSAIRGWDSGSWTYVRFLTFDRKVEGGDGQRWFEASFEGCLTVEL